MMHTVTPPNQTPGTLTAAEAVHTLIVCLCWVPRYAGVEVHDQRLGSALLCIMLLLHVPALSHVHVVLCLRVVTRSCCLRREQLRCSAESNHHGCGAELTAQCLLAAPSGPFIMQFYKQVVSQALAVHLQRLRVTSVQQTRQMVQAQKGWDIHHRKQLSEVRSARLL
jgi:hypothetical protein